MNRRGIACIPAPNLDAEQGRGASLETDIPRASTGTGGILQKEGSYRIRNFAANVDAEIRRLKAQVELFWDKELRCLRMFGLLDGMRILECGCGPGHVIEKLLQSLPKSDVTGVEIDPFLVQKSRESLALLGADRARVLEQSVMQMDFDDHRFDFVIARMVLEHLTDSLSAVKEIHRVLKSGGKAVFIDNDFDMHLRAYPDIAELHELYDAYCRCRIEEGGQPRIGRELPGILQEAGFANVDLEVVSAHSRVTGDEVFLKSEGSGIPAQLVKKGYLSRDVLDRLARKWHDALQHKDHMFFRQIFVAGGEKLPSQVGRVISECRKAVRGTHPSAVHEIHNAESPQDICRLLTVYLQVQIAAFLEVEQESTPIDHPLVGLGVNSIMSVELANSIETDFKVKISAVDVLEAASISALAERLEMDIEKVKREGSASVLTHEKQGGERGRASRRNTGAGLAENENQWEEGYI